MIYAKEESFNLTYRVLSNKKNERVEIFLETLCRHCLLNLFADKAKNLF